MDHLFQADVDGALEYLECNPSDAIGAFQSSLRSTLDYYQCSPDARMALARVLFRAWHFCDVHRTDFSVSRYGRGIHTDEYLALIDSNELFDYTMSYLYLLPVEDALAALQELIRHDTNKKAPRFLSHYIRIANALMEDFDFMEAIRFLVDNKYSIAPDQRLELQRVFKDQLKSCRPSRTTNLENLMMILSLPMRSNFEKKRKRIEIHISSPQLSSNMKEEWDFTKDKSHRNAFVIICDHFQKTSRAFPSLVAKESSNVQRTLIPEDLFQELMKKLSDNNNRLNQRKQWCLQALYNQIPGWKSVLTMMVQFTDLWIEDWIQPHAEETFLSLISSENLLIHYYQHIRRLLNILHLEITEKQKAEDICRFYYKLLDRIEEPANLIALRNFIFADMIREHPMTYNLFCSVSVVNFKGELTKAMNQHVTTEDGRLDSPVVRKLLALSALYPYGIVREIIGECFMSKDKQKSIIPLLYQMGGLCRLGIANTEDGKITTLLDEAFQEYFTDILSGVIDFNLTDIASFFRGASHDLEEYANHVPVLVPYKHAAFSFDIPINLASFLRDRLPDMLAISEELTSTKLGLEILAATCQVDSEIWGKLSDVNTLQESILLKAEPVELCFALTKIQNLRYANSSNLSLHYIELALMIQQKIFAAISLTTHYDTPRYSRILDILKILEEDFDWRARMVWEDLHYSICYKYDPSSAKISIPSILEPIVRTLAGSCQIFECHGISDQDSWDVFFDSCKLSLSFINQAFAAKESWQEGFQQLCCNPTSDSLVIKHLFQSLYPTCSQSVTSEYERLLVHFLKKLYYSFNAHESILMHTYRGAYMKNIVQELDSQDAKTFWIIIHCIALLRYPRSTMNDLQAEGYFIASIIKVIQSLKNWSDIASVGPEFRSLKRVRDGLYDPEVSRDNLAAAYGKDGQQMEDGSDPLDQEDAMIDVFFPFNTRKHRSARTLSLLTFCMLCQACETLGSITMNDSIRVCLLQITEGLRDRRRRGDFLQLTESQGKSRISSWKKEKGNKRRAILRPLFTQKEKEALILPHLDLLDDQKQTLYRALDLGEQQQQRSEERQGKRYEAIYCLKGPVK